MAANADSRETTRDALTILLSTALVGTGKPVEAVYPHKKGDFGGESPVVLVLSASATRTQFGLGSAKYRTDFGFQLQVWVADAEGTWTEADVEDRIDLIEKEIADTIADNRSTVSWEYLEHSGASSIIDAIRKGKPYVIEIISVVARVIDT